MTTFPASAIISLYWSKLHQKHQKNTERAVFNLPAVLKGDNILKTGLLVAADLYGCAEDALEQNGLKSILEKYAEVNHMHMQSIRIEQEDETNYGIYSICKSGHIIIHVNEKKGFVAIDGFSCSEDADPEKMVRELCSFLSPDKMKLTYVDRGDFGKKADMKPRHRNKSRKIAQMRNMTKRFGKLLIKPKSL